MVEMEIYKDLLKIEKSKARTIHGFVALIISISWIAIKIVFNENTNTFDTIFGISAALFFALTGIVNITEGFGISSSRLFGKAFILINNEKISIKSSVFVKEKTIHWNKIKTINYRVNHFLFILKKTINL